MEEALREVRQKYPKFFSGIVGLREEQREVIETVLGGSDVFVCLPTGFGKSLTYILPPLLADELEEGVEHISVVVSPLLTIINDQVSKLQAAGIKAHGITGTASPQDIQAVQRGDTQVIFITPECAATRAFRETLRSLSQRITILVLDECHCISTWGKDFRKSYRKLGELSTFMDCPVLFLTATATRSIKEDILSIFDIRDCVTIHRSPDRPNIRLNINHTTHKITQLQWVLDYYLEHGVNGKKCLIFTSDIMNTTRIYLWMLDELDKANKAYIGDDRLVDERIIDMYHSHMSADTDQRVQKEYPKTSSTVRVLISTIKMGMGVDISDIDLVIIFGAPQHIIDLWQELGRGARGAGRRGLGVVYLTGLSLKGCKDNDIKALIEQEQCFRRTILDAFNVEDQHTSNTQNTNMHTACSGDCVQVCQCSLCRCCNHCSNSCSCVSSNGDLRAIFESI